MSACEWQPAEGRAAYASEPAHAEAEWAVGADPNWHLCSACARLPEFGKLRKRTKLKAKPPSAQP
jgi:hypothetical protein